MHRRGLATCLARVPFTSTTSRIVSSSLRYSSSSSSQPWFLTGQSWTGDDRKPADRGPRREAKTRKRSKGPPSDIFDTRPEKPVRRKGDTRQSRHVSLTNLREEDHASKPGEGPKEVASSFLPWSSLIGTPSPALHDAGTTEANASLEKKAFEAARRDDEDSELLASTWYSYDDIPVGSFLELRRNKNPVYAILLSKGSSAQGWTSMTLNGEMHNHMPTDIFFAIPNVVEVRVTQRCGTEEFTTVQTALEARQMVLKGLRTVLTASEEAYVNIASKMTRAYEVLMNEDHLQWSQVTATDVARHPRLLNMQITVIPPTTLLAVHRHLMDKSDEFVADGLNFLVTQRFRIRPFQQLEDIRAVDKMLAQDDPSLLSFCALVKKLVATNRSPASAATESRLSLTPHQGIAWSKQHLRIVRFLQAAASSKRFIQRNPYIINACTILRRIDDPGVMIDESEVAEFLKRSGFIAPWDDLVARERDFALEPDTGSTGYTMKSEATSSCPEVYLGLDQLHAHDLAASIRHDFGTLPVYVIDDVGAQELDDGLSIETTTSPDGTKSHWVHVHIADPTSVLPPTHEIAQQAHRSAATMYLAHKTIPMLPQLAEFEQLSLGSVAQTGRPENVVTASFKVDEHGGISDYKVRAGVVRNVQLLRYDDVDASLGANVGAKLYPFGGAPTPPPAKPLTPQQVQDLKQIASIIRSLISWRCKNGNIIGSFSVAELTISPRSLPELPTGTSIPHLATGFPDMQYSIETVLHIDSGSRQIVSECMKAASRVVSMFMRDRGLPMLRRTAGPIKTESEEALAELMGMRDEFGIVHDFARFSQLSSVPEAAIYSTEQKGHDQLGIPASEGYVHFTSPLRRFVDMIAHWQVKHALVHPNRQPLFSEEWLRACAHEMTWRLKIVKRMSTASSDYWALKFIERWMNHPELRPDVEDPLQSLVAIPVNPPRVSIDGNFNTVVRIPGLGMRATMIHKDFRSVRIGLPIDVRVQSLRFGFAPRLVVTPK